MRSNFKHTTPALWPNIRGHAMSAHRVSVPITHNTIEALVLEVSLIRGVEESAIKLLDLLGAKLRAAIALNDMSAVSEIATSLEAGSAVLADAVVKKVMKTS